MGNSLPIDKISNSITELSETTDLNENFLFTQFQSLIQLLERNELPFDDIQNVFNNLVTKSNFCEQNLINFAYNILKFQNIDKDNQIFSKTIKHILFYLNIICNTIKFFHEERFDHFFSQYLKKNKNIYQNCENFGNLFPFNVLKYCINIINDKENIIQNNKTIELKEKNIILNYSLSIIYCIVCSYTPLNAQENSIEKIDLFKFVFYNREFISEEDFTRFFSKLSLIFFSSFENLISKKIELNTYLKTSFRLMLYFIDDTNRIIFEGNTIQNNFSKCCFEIEQNEVFSNFIHLIVNQEEDLYTIIKNYNKFYNGIITYFVQANYRLLNEFVISFYTHYSELNLTYKNSVNYFLLKILDLIPNMFEICSIKEFLPQIFQHLINDLNSYGQNGLNFKTLILLNKILLSTNFNYMLMHSINSFEEEEDLFSNCVDCLYFLINKLNHIKNDNLSMLCLITVYNILIQIPKITFEDEDEAIFNDYFSIVDKILINSSTKKESQFGKLGLLKYYLQITLLLTYRAEPQSHFLLHLIKNFGKIQNYIKTMEERKIDQSQIVIYKLLQEVILVSQKINEVADKITQKVKEEGIDLNFAQNYILLKIINKILIIEPKENDALLPVNISITNNKLEKEILNANYNIEKIYEINKYRILNY